MDLSEGHLHFSTFEIYFLPSSDQISLFDILAFVLAAGKLHIGLCAFVLAARLAKPFDDEELDMKHWSDQRRRPGGYAGVTDRFLENERKAGFAYE